MKNRFDIKVLLVDDNPVFLHTVELCFSDIFRVATASDLSQALMEVQYDSSIDVLVSDKNLDEHRGCLPLLEYMRYHKPYTPVILCSAEDGTRAKKELYCHAFIDKSKPGSIAKLQDKIIQLVDAMNN